tara:strand:+ start:39349 stop:39756 length:408 start_codon:yes stop_codon:yes gene_type:complete
MIQFKINKCPDEDYIGEIKTNKNLIYIGSNLTSDVYLPDKKIKTNHLFIEIAENKLLAHSHADVEYFWVNGKRSKNFKFLNIGDKIKIGESEIEIIIFANTEVTDKRNALNAATDVLISSKQEYLPIVQNIQKEL